jgi:hypothetical protein
MKITFGALISPKFINTMMKPILTFLLLLSQFCTISKDLRNRHLRTDGFYFYDNRIDSIATMPGGRERQLAMLKEMREKGFNIKLDSSSTSLDSEAKLTEGSTDIRFIAFLDDTSGIVFGSIYRRNVLNKFIDYYNSRKTGTTFGDKFKIQTISNVVFTSDSSFKFRVGLKGDYFEKENSCTLRNDSLVVRSTRPFFPGAINEYRYFFVPFGNIPPDLLTISKKQTEK